MTDAGMDTDASMETDAGMAPIERTVDGWVVDQVSTLEVEGAQVCVADHPEIACATTAADGTFAVTGALSGLILLDITHPDYMPGLFHLEMGPDGASFNGAPIVPLAIADVLFTMAGASADPTKGHLASGLMLPEFSGPAEGGAVTIEPSSGIGPVYFSAAGLPDPSLTSVTGGGFTGFNMDPGEVTVTLSYPGGTCARTRGVSWPGSDPSRLDTTRVRIRAGYITVFGTSFCTPAAP